MVKKSKAGEAAIPAQSASSAPPSANVADSQKTSGSSGAAKSTKDLEGGVSPSSNGAKTSKSARGQKHSGATSKAPAREARVVSPTIRRRRVGTELRKIRTESGTSVEVIASALEVTTSTVYRMELGRVGIKPRDVNDYAEACHYQDDEQIAYLKSMASEGRQRGWWARYSDTIEPLYQTYVGLEADAEQLRMYDAIMFNGLLQTREYALATFEHVVQSSREHMEKRIELRIERQSRLSEDLELISVMDEAVIRRILGDRDVSRNQLDHVLEMSENPNVHLQVLPFSVAAYPGMLGSFTVMSFRAMDDPKDDGYRHPDIAYVEGAGLDQYEEFDRVSQFRKVFATLSERALSEEDTRDLIKEVRDNL
ncbi:helix-turn-helix domain-containing protein [Natronoglycomyces albus]|uniref:Helix-turn-helix domain-containing protein n=1 Tax=Natronoglycomyces albus TaxID=2811108 RepID=A0A895XV17_9ACTN|nr:helix-turn-helix transcriptional regulator [Natronoglycomyces albus]QSB06070.1 helix-turn-helix domain-containing protein [Natronoglycomyces albus]